MKEEFEMHCQLRIDAMSKTRRMITNRRKAGKMTSAFQKMDEDMYHLIKAYELVAADLRLTHHG